MNSICKVIARLLIPMVALVSPGATVQKEPLRSEVLGTSVSENGYEQVQIRVTNVSDANVAAYVLRMSLIDSEGRTVAVTERVVMEGLGGPKAKRALPSRDSELVDWTVPIKNTWAKFSVSVDYVKFVSKSSLQL